MDFSPLFNDPFLSDYQLRLANTDNQELCRLHVHGVVLAGQSPYFKSLLTNWVGDSKVLTLTVEEGELTPMMQLLQSVYRGTVPKETSAEDLVSMLVLADR
jgi:hypothetical protein